MSERQYAHPCNVCGHVEYRGTASHPVSCSGCGRWIDGFTADTAGVTSPPPERPNAG
jgi:hypothetical protein